MLVFGLGVPIAAEVTDNSSAFFTVACECFVELREVSQVLQTRSAQPCCSGAAQMEIEKSRDEATKEPLPQLAEALLSRQRAEGFLEVVRVSIFKQAECLRREHAGQRFSDGLLCHLAEVCCTERRAADVSVDRVLHLC